MTTTGYLQSRLNEFDGFNGLGGQCLQTVGNQVLSLVPHDYERSGLLLAGRRSWERGFRAEVEAYPESRTTETVL